jgi:iron(III) transport system ATP-binding protein
MTDSHLKIERACKRFGRTVALDDVSFAVEQGSLVCLLGPSGCGKTTVLRSVAGLEKLDSGRVFLAGRDVTPLPPAQRRFGMVFQSYALFPNLTVGENVAYGLRGKGTTPAERKTRVGELLDLVDLGHAAKRFPAQLSGGQQQRVALARALVLSPDILLLDEPLSALDAKVRVRLRSEIRSLQQRLGITTLLVTHDQEEALTMADGVVVMNEGAVEQAGSPREVYERPATAFVADFMGSVNFFEAADLRRLPGAGTGCPGGAQILNGADIIGIRPEHIKVGTRAPGGGAAGSPRVPGMPPAPGGGMAAPAGGAQAPADTVDAGSDCDHLSIPADLQQVEFCGSYLRLTARAAWEGSTKEYMVTLSSPITGNGSSELLPGGNLWLRLPAERLLHYSR